MSTPSPVNVNHVISSPLFHAASNLPITLLITPLGSQMAQPFLIYVALMVVAAVAVVIRTGAENLSRTAHRQVEQP